MTKAIEALKAASQSSGDASGGPCLLDNLKNVHDQIQAASPEGLPLLLEGKGAYPSMVVIIALVIS